MGVVQMVTKTKGAGRPKQPIEKRQVLSDNPHKNRTSEKDVPMCDTLGLEKPSIDPPIDMGQYERECWDRIVGAQIELGKSGWLVKTDESYLVATCGLYGRWREVRNEIKQLLDEGIGLLDENGKANPLLNVEANLATKYLASLSALGMVPTRRQISAVEKDEEKGDGLLK